MTKHEEQMDGRHGQKKQRNALLRECYYFTGYDIWHDGDQYIVADTGYKCKSIHDLCHYCEVYENQSEAEL